MSVMTDAIEYRRLRAPREDGGTLVDPPLSAVGELIERNRAARAQSDCEIAGESLSALSAEARRDLFSAALQYTRSYRDVELPPTTDTSSLLVAGHQPQLFHPGVWYKNFVLGRLAREHEAVAINLVIDSDAIRSAAIRVPGGSAEDPVIENIECDGRTDEIPYEERTIQNPDLFDSFASRVGEVIKPLVSNPLIHRYWSLVKARAVEQNNLGMAISQARHQLEGEWGAVTLELPQSRLCELPAFDRFALHLLRSAEPLQSTYNAAANEYRRVHRIRNQAHPVPNLATDDEWIEVPFWLWTAANPKRRRAWVRRTADELWVGTRGEALCKLPLADSSTDRALAALAQMRAEGIKLRTRALVTTMFARLVLGDLFLHGIGGAKYDQVTDAIVRRFFGIEPPEYLAVTATIRLPIDRPGITEDDLRLVNGRLRELQFHAERWLDGTAGDGVQHLVESKNKWISTPQSPQNARERCRAIRNINEALQPHVASLRDRLLQERVTLRHDRRTEKLLGSREFAFCLYPEKALRDLLGAL
jgi:hypothetical protein